MGGENEILDAITPEDEQEAEPQEQPKPEEQQEQQQQQDEFDKEIQAKKPVPYDRFSKLAAERRELKERLAKIPKDFDPDKYSKDQESWKNLTEREGFLQKVADTIASHPWLDQTLTDLIEGRPLSKAKLLEAVAALKDEQQQNQQQGQPQNEMDKRIQALERQLQQERDAKEHERRVGQFEQQTNKLLANPKFKEALKEKAFLEEVFDRAEIVQARMGDKELVSLEKVADGVLKRITEQREKWLEEQRKAGLAKPGAGIPKGTGPAGSSKPKPKSVDPRNYNQVIDSLVDDLDE